MYDGKHHFLHPQFVCQILLKRGGFWLIALDANIRFSAAEIYSIASDRKVKTFGLEGYFGTITVFHELHCLVRIKFPPLSPIQQAPLRIETSRDEKKSFSRRFYSRGKLTPQTPRPPEYRNASTKAFTPNTTTPTSPSRHNPKISGTTTTASTSFDKA